MASLNPLRCSGSDLPPNLLLAAKLLALLLLLRGEVHHIPPPFLPFISALDAISHPALFQRGLQAAFLLSALGVLFNRKARLCCLALAGVLLACILSSRLFYANNRLFVAALLAMIALQPAREDYRFLRWQMALVYAGAALNKVLDPDWGSGVFFNNFMAVFDMRWTRLAASLLPPMLAARILSWTSIIAEFSLSGLWLTGAAPGLTIWTGLVFHATLSTFVGATFGNFFFASVIATLFLVRYPLDSTVVLYDGDCGICAKTRRFFEFFDFDRALSWQPYQSAPNRFGIPEAALQERLHIALDGKIYSGFKAFKEMALLLPVSYFAALTLFVALMRDACPVPALALAWGTLAVFFPYFEPIGERLYLLVARNRLRLSGPGAACGVHRE